MVMMLMVEGSQRLLNELTVWIWMNQLVAQGRMLGSELAIEPPRYNPASSEYVQACRQANLCSSKKWCLDERLRCDLTPLALAGGQLQIPLIWLAHIRLYAFQNGFNAPTAAQLHLLLLGNLFEEDKTDSSGNYLQANSDWAGAGASVIYTKKKSPERH